MRPLLEPRPPFKVSLTDEGSAILSAGKTPEFMFFEAVTAEGVETAELEAKLGAQLKIGESVYEWW